MAERSDLPLFDWDERRRQRKDAQGAARRRALLMIGAVASIGLCATITTKPRPRLGWKASASAQVGVDHVTAGTGPSRRAMGMRVGERRVGTEGGSACRCRGLADTAKKKKN